MSQQFDAPSSPLGAGGDEVIHTTGLTKIYGSGNGGRGRDLTPVDHLDLSVGKGGIFGLLGPNGAGRATTVGMLTTRLTTHHSEEAEGLCDRVAIMGHGRILALDTPVRRRAGDRDERVAANGNGTIADEDIEVPVTPETVFINLTGTRVLVNPLVYMSEGSRAGMTTGVVHMPLLVVHAVLVGLAALSTALGVSGSEKRVLS